MQHGVKSISIRVSDSARPHSCTNGYTYPNEFQDGLWRGRYSCNQNPLALASPVKLIRIRQTGFKA